MVRWTFILPDAEGNTMPIDPAGQTLCVVHTHTIIERQHCFQTRSALKQHLSVRVAGEV
jgi:hypothetical protein